MKPPPWDLMLMLPGSGVLVEPTSAESLWFCRGRVSPVSRDFSSAMSGYTNDRSLWGMKGDIPVELQAFLRTLIIESMRSHWVRQPVEVQALII